MKYEALLFIISFTVAGYMWIFGKAPWTLICIYWSVLALKNFNSIGGEGK